MDFLGKKFNENIPTTKLITSIFVLSLVFFSLIRFTPLSAAVHGIQSKIFSMTTTLNNYFIQLFKDEDTLANQLTECQALLSENQLDKQENYNLRERNNELERLLDYKQTLEYETIPANVLSKSVNNDITMLVDQGSHDGVIPGLPVIINDGYLIGIIESVNQYTSNVRLLDDSKTSIPVTFVGIDGSKTSGLLSGKGGYLLHVGYIPKDESIFIGQIVSTSGLSELIPSGLIIGHVSNVLSDETEPFQEAEVQSAYEIANSSMVLIINTTSATLYEE